MRRRTEKTKKMKGHGWSQPAKTTLRSVRVSCFVCDEEITGKGVPLLIGHTTHSKTGLPTKIGELMGDGFMVVVSIEDTLCKRCSALLNHLDKLESDLFVVKKALTDYLKVKYQLTDEDLAGHASPHVEEVPTVAPVSHLKTNGHTELYTTEIVDMKERTEGQSFQYEYEGDKMESEGSESECSSTTKRVNVEIILEDSSSQRRSFSQQPPEKLQQCGACGFETLDLEEFRHHPEQCGKSLLHKCTICGKMFESNMDIQNHIMEAHLSKWTCHFCSITFSEEVEFNSHMKSHLGSNFYAQHVKLEIQSDSDNSNHYDPPKNLLGNYECNICDYQSNNKLLFDDHLRQHVVLKMFKCDVCGIRFEDKELLANHTKSHHNEKVYFKCGICTVSFENENDLVVHMKSHEEKPTTDKAKMLTEWAAARQQDFLTHSDMSIDNSDAKKSEEIADKSNDADDKFDGTSFQFHTCNTCSLTFVNDLLYKEHMKSHNIIVKDITQHENSLISSLVEPNDYVENVMDDSLEDIFAKMHSQSEASYEAQGKEGLPKRHIFKCDSCSEEFNKVVDLQVHKTKHEVCNNMDIVENASKSDQITIKLEHENNVGQTKRGMLSANSKDGTIEQRNSNQSSGNETNEEDKADQMNAESNSESKPEICLPEDYEYDDEDDSLENIYNMVCEKKLSSIDVNSSITLDTGYFFKLKTEDPNESNLNVVPKSETDSDVAINIDSITDNKLLVKKTYVCAMCGYKTSNMVDLRRHFKDHREEGMHVCKICNKFLSNATRLKQHMKTHNSPPPPEKMTCPNCFKEFPDKTHLQHHFQENHQREKIVYQCQFCQLQFTSRKAYKVHEETHPERFEFKCDGCNQTFMREKQLSDHKDLQHRDPHCRYCGKEILKIKTLRNHELRHQKEKDSYECDICKRVFKTKTGLRHHVAVHTGEYKYCCDYCGRGFMSRMMMEEHRSMHTKEERYVCDVCGRKFSFQSTYWIHRKWHDNPYPYKCSFCGRMFRHSSLLAVHKRKHTGERPYKCPHCPLTFPVGGTLKRHLILHTGVYPFNCDSCKRGFTTRHKYATHLAKVHGDFELLNSRPQQNEFKMVIRDRETQPEQESTAVWQYADDSEQGEINFKLAVAAAGNDSLDQLETGIPCSIIPEDLLADNMMPTRVVEIVLDEASQAVATVTLADPTAGGLLPDLWYQ